MATTARKARGMLVVVKKKEIDRGKGPSSPNEPVSSVTKMDLMVR